MLNFWLGQSVLRVDSGLLKPERHYKFRTPPQYRPTVPPHSTPPHPPPYSPTRIHPTRIFSSFSDIFNFQKRPHRISPHVYFSNFQLNSTLKTTPPYWPTRIFLWISWIRYVWGTPHTYIILEKRNKIRVGRYGGVVFKVEFSWKFEKYTCGDIRWGRFWKLKFMKKRKIYAWGGYVWVNTVVDVGGYCGAVLWGGIVGRYEIRNVSH